MICYVHMIGRDEGHVRRWVLKLGVPEDGEGARQEWDRGIAWQRIDERRPDEGGAPEGRPVQSRWSLHQYGRIMVRRKIYTDF